MNYFENIRDVLRDAYHSFLDIFSNSSYAMAGDAYYNTDNPSQREGSKLANVLFAHSEQHKKGSSHLHHSPHMISVHSNGRTIPPLDKRKKPANMTLVQWIMEQTGVNRKEASQAVKKSC